MLSMIVLFVLFGELLMFLVIFDMFCMNPFFLIYISYFISTLHNYSAAALLNNSDNSDLSQSLPAVEDDHAVFYDGKFDSESKYEVTFALCLVCFMCILCVVYCW
jgi:hypothetical protein